MLRYRHLLRSFIHIKNAFRALPLVPSQKYSLKIILPCSLSFSLLTLIGLEKKLSAEDELILKIKHCVLFIQREEYDKAEQLLHVSLRQAQQIHHELGITYIYDVMANLALERGQYEKAKQLFVAVSQRIMSNGASEDDIRVIHISIKLARISHMLKDYTTAQLGYDWCLEKLSSNPSQDSSELNVKLLAMTEDWYGRLFVDCGRHELGLTYMKKAYEKMTTLSDIEQEHLIIQLNDMGTVSDIAGKTDDSIEYFTNAIDLGKKVPEMPDLGAIYINLGRAYMKKSMLDIARKSCGFGWRLGVLAKNDDIKKEAEECIKEIKNMS